MEIRNPFLGQTLTLDWSNKDLLVRTSEDGTVEAAGQNHQVWVDADWPGPQEGDFYRPFKSFAAALAAVTEPGVIRIISAPKGERPVFHKRVTLRAARDTVTIGQRS